MLYLILGFVCISGVVAWIGVGIKHTQSEHKALYSKIHALTFEEAKNKFDHVAIKSVHWSVSRAEQEAKNRMNRVFEDYSLIEFDLANLYVSETTEVDALGSVPDGFLPIGASGDGDTFAIILNKRDSNVVCELGLYDNDVSNCVQFDSIYHFLLYCDEYYTDGPSNEHTSQP